MIYNYINKTNYDLSIQDFDNSNNPGDFTEIEKSKKYGELLCLGSTINTNIFTFTKKFIEKPNEKTKPKIKYLVKLIKNQCKIFKNYSYEFFMYHIYSKTGMNKNLSPQDMQIIKSYFLKENNLKELGFSNRNSVKNFNNNNLTSTNSNIDIESLQRKIKCTSQINSNLFTNEKFYVDNYSYFIRNDSVEIDLVNNFNKLSNGAAQKNLADDYKSNHKIIDISSNNIYVDNNQTLYSDSIQSDLIQNKDKNRNIYLDTRKKSIGNRIKIQSKIFENKKYISEKKNKILNQFFTSTTDDKNKINNKNKFTSNIFNNQQSNNFNLSKAISIISPNDTGCEKHNFYKLNEANSFFNKDLIDSSLLINSDASKSGLNNNTINLKNNQIESIKQ